MAVTLKMISEHTGFSQTTISRVLNSDPTFIVEEETRRTICETAKRLGYSGGTGRRRRQTKTTEIQIGIAEMLSPAEQMTDPYFLYLRNFVEQQCAEARILTMLLQRNSDGCYRTADIEVDGIVAIGYFSEKQIASLQSICNNIVFLDSSPDEMLYDSVVLNYELGMKQALDHLRRFNHTNIGFIGPKRLYDEVNHITWEPRRQYYERYMREHGLYRASLIVEVPLRDQVAVTEEFTMRLRTMPKEVQATAWVTVNEECAISVIRALRKEGYRVPEDVSVIGFNDTAMSCIIEPPLTSISPHIDYMAEIAVQLVQQRIRRSGLLTKRQYPQKVVIPTMLIREDSTVAELK